ncbi:MAG TPA: DNA-processing protein DprA [Acidimicrobiales bacterium]|jgi:DNA processing protein
MSEHMGTALPEEAFAAALAAQPRVGPSHLRAFLCVERPSVAWQQHGKGSVADVARLWQRYEELGVSVLTQDDPDYPPRLRGDPEAPAVLFCRGNPAVLHQQPTVALVGTRSPTRYGIGVAAQLGAELAATGVSVVSGLALGIDGAAHEGACTAGAPPMAVVAGGLGDPYPRRHERLWERVAAQGAIVSESPLGVRTEKWRFPVRNRLLAGLSDVVVVVESRHGGGSRHTVDAAAARGIPVGAVPGSIRSPTSEGTNALLVEGCFPVCGVSDILVALALRGITVASRTTGTASGPAADGLSTTYQGPDQALFDVLSPDPTSLDRLVFLTGLSLAELCGGLERLAQAGLARDVGGWWERT